MLFSERRLDGFISVNNGLQSTDVLDTGLQSTDVLDIGDHESIDLTFDENHHSTVMDDTSRTENIDTSVVNNIEDSCQTEINASVEENEGQTASQNCSKIRIEGAIKPTFLLDFHSCSSENKTHSKTDLDKKSKVIVESHLSQSLKITLHSSMNVQPESCVKVGPYGDGWSQVKSAEEVTCFCSEESAVPLLPVEGMRVTSEGIYCGNDDGLSTDKLGCYNAHSIGTNEDKNGGNIPPMETSHPSIEVHSLCDTNESFEETSLSQGSIEPDVHRQSSVVRTFRTYTSMGSNDVSADDWATHKDVVTREHASEIIDVVSILATLWENGV